jgi:hypothetical protein
MPSESVDYVLRLYHGTNGVNSNKIIKAGFKLLPDTKDDHWLGPGIYFFREDKEQAILFAQARYRKASEVHVLETVLSVQENDYLDLDSRKGLGYLRDLYNQISLMLKEEGVDMKSYTEHKLRHLIIKMLPAHITVVKRTFPAEKSNFDTFDPFIKMGLNLLGVQVCVRRPDIINGDINIVFRKVRYAG